MSAADDLRHVVAQLCATVHVSDVEPGVVRMDLISVPEELRGNGFARQALACVCSWADETGTVVLLTATYGLGADVRRLVLLYMAYRFLPVEVTALHEVRMRRTPLALVPAHIATADPAEPRPGGATATAAPGAHDIS